MAWASPVITSEDSFILLADGLKIVQKISTGAMVAGGFWISASFARGNDPLADYTIKRISFEYNMGVSPSNIKVYTNPDGAKISQFTLKGTFPTVARQVEQSGLAEVFPYITGRDPRIKLELNPSLSPLDQRFTVHTLQVEVIERARL